MTQANEELDVASAQTTQPYDAANSSTPCQQRLLFSSAGASAQSFAMLAVPNHAQIGTSVDVEPINGMREDARSDPIAEAGWIAAADALLMGGLLNDW